MANLRYLVEYIENGAPGGEHPEWKAYPASVSGGNTEMANALRFKVPAITTFGMTVGGVAPY